MNHRHTDFQSVALPTELPDLKSNQTKHKTPLIQPTRGANPITPLAETSTAAMVRQFDKKINKKNTFFVRIYLRSICLAGLGTTQTSTIVQTNVVIPAEKIPAQAAALTP